MRSNQPLTVPLPLPSPTTSAVITSADFYLRPDVHHVVRRNGVVLTSLVAEYDPPEPHEDVLRDPDNAAIEDLFTFRVNLRKYPQFAFVPSTLLFVGPLLGRLSRYKVVQCTSGLYGLEPERRTSWIWLEDTLSVAISCICGGMLVPMDVDFFPYPQTFGYRKLYKSKKRALTAAKMSRDAFGGMIGLLSMQWSMIAEKNLRPSYVPQASPCCSPQDLLRQKTTFAETIIQDIVDMHSSLGPRVGLMVIPSECAWFAHYEPALAYAGVRYWIYWGVLTPAQAMYTRKVKAAPRYYPHPEVIARCLAALAHNDWPSITSGQLLMLEKQQAEASIPEEPPVLDVGPVSARGAVPQTPHEFILCRAKQEGARREKASPDELLKWKHREGAAKKRGWTRKSKVYHWPEVGGVRLRTYVERSQIHDVWETTQNVESRTDGQRRYSAVFDEWDICTEFDPSDQPSFDDGDPAPFDSNQTPSTPAVAPITSDAVPPGNEGPAPTNSAQPPRSPTPSASIPLPTSTPHPLPSVPSTSRTIPALIPPSQPLPPNHNEQGLSFAHGVGVDDEELAVPDLDVLMYERYGFDVNSLAFDLKNGIIKPPSDMLPLDQASRILMEKNAVSSARCEPAVRFIVTAIDSHKEVPERYWDLKNGGLRESNPGFFVFEPLKLQSLHSRGTLQGYLVTPTSAKYIRPWVVFFESAITAVQCIREKWGPSLESVIENACQYGFPIHLFLREDPRRLPPVSNPPALYQRRVKKEGYKPTAYDFHAYQSMVGFMLMQSRLKATALQGGLLGRICSPYLSLEDVAEGPSSDAIRYGLRWKSEEDSVIFVEDYVAEEEVHLICGFFYVDNCGFSLSVLPSRSHFFSAISAPKRNQLRSFSFFPSPHVWETSGIHTLGWNNSEEEKFRSLLRALNPSRDVPPSEPILVPFKSNGDWRSHLRLYQKRVKRFIACVEDACTAFISSL